MIFTQDAKSTDAAKWCVKHGFDYDEKRLKNFEDALFLEDLTETERENKRNFAVMRLAELEGKTEKRSFALHERSYMDGRKEYSLTGDGESILNKLKGAFDLCYIFDFSRGSLTVFFAADEMNAKLEELKEKALTQEEDARRIQEHIDKEKEAIREAQERLNKWERQLYAYNFAGGAVGDLKDMQIALGLKSRISG